MHLRHICLITGALLLCCASLASAAPGFITSSSVTQDGNVAWISVKFACRVEYIDHLPVIYGDRLRVQIDSTGICSGVAPTAANDRGQYRPFNADLAKLREIDYDGLSGTGQTLTFVFSEVVQYVVSPNSNNDGLSIQVQLRDTETPVKATEPASGGVRVQRPAEPQSDYVINLSSSRTPYTASDRQIENIMPGLKVFESEVVLGGVTWYRLRLGVFDSSESAHAAMIKLHATHPTAWVDRADKNSAGNTTEIDSIDAADTDIYTPNAALANVGLDQVDALMADARRAMVAGELSRAVQIYTKVLRVPNHDRHAEAQELLGLAREKNAQTAHAKAEYQRYLSLYPNGEGANRVSQRLAALLASNRISGSALLDTSSPASRVAASRKSDWRVQTFASQYYRRDANQVNEEDQIISQSAVFTDVNLDVRRRGERFDFSSRLSAGYRSDLLSEDEGSGDDARISYAYADLADDQSGLRGRVGRQSKNTGGVLGRFDGLNLSYRASERILVSTVFGQPVNSASDGLESERTFYGASVDYGPVFENLELGLFFIQQDIEGVEDRQAVGTEFRYFGGKQSIWGLIDYDTSYSEISSAYLQGSWRVTPRLNLSGSFDRRHTPYLSTGSALIGQPVETFSELLILYSEEEIRQFSIDRTPISSSFTFGASYSLSPKMQINFDVNQTAVDAAPESGGIPAMPEASYTYFSTTLIASSVFKEGDSTMIGLRYSDSNSAQVSSLTIDSRYPVGKRWRINPRLRIDQRQILSDSSDEWQVTPGLRVQYRHNRKFRVEFEAGKRFSQRTLETSELDRESYFLSLGYQVFF
jgi:tetratricopeptide (TPR) repeat protein